MTDRRAKKACTECRQQKARCDAHNFEDSICSRCRKMHLECVMSDSFEREHKRRKLSEIERENIRLRQKLHSTKAKTPDSDRQCGTPHQSHTVTTTPEQEAFTSVDITGHGGQGTMRRTLDDVMFQAEAVDQLFEIFFKDFSWLLPILDPTTPPNVYHSTSPFLFWTIVGVASRNYPSPPLPLHELRLKIFDMALSTLKVDASVQSIQGMLILLTWPFPKTHQHPDVTSQLNGAMLHMALQMGLHIPISSHEYSRVKLQLTSAEIDKRVVLWAHIIVLYQRICLAKGIPANSVQDLTLDPEQRISLMEKIPADVKSQFQIQSIVTRCGNEAAKIGLRTMTEDRERALDIVLRVHEREVDNVYTSPSAHARLCLLIGRITIQALHLFRKASDLAEDELLLAKLTMHACEWLETCGQELDSGRLCSAAVPFYYLYSMLTCSAILLRMLKVPLFAGKILDVQRATSALQKGIDILDSMSLQENDTASRSSMIMQQLWQSKKAFLRQSTERKEIEPVPLRIRSRIAMCHLLDTWAWWREEFGGPGRSYFGVLAPPLQNSTKAEGVNGATDADSETQCNNDVPHSPVDPASAPTMDLSMAGTQSVYQPETTPSNPAIANEFMNLNGFAQAQLDPNYGNLIGDDLFSDLWSYWPDSHNWTTGLT